MIKNFSDHAANERTFLAWVRTAIAVMAFGFLIERFDLFLHDVVPSSPRRALPAAGQRFANAAGLAFIVLGTVMIAIAAARLLVTARRIDSEAVHLGIGERLDIALALLLALLGGSLLLYLSHAVMAAF
jgi:putative membrane protein